MGNRKALCYLLTGGQPPAQQINFYRKSGMVSVETMQTILSRQTDPRIRTAIVAIFEFCIAEGRPALESLEECIRDLENDGGWNAADIEITKCAVTTSLERRGLLRGH